MKVTIGGDVSPQKRLEHILETRNFEQVFGELKPIFEKSDISIVNFETTIPAPDSKPIVKLGPNISTTSNLIEALKWAGVDIVTLANNHACDYGIASLEHTINILHNAEIDTVGASVDSLGASDILYKKVGKEKIAIINCCEHEFGFATANVGGTNALYPIRQYYDIMTAKAKADYVLIIVHGGHEYFQLPSTRMQDTYRFFIDVGADAVINHHQHCFSGMETYQGKPIYYGLGNLAFEALSENVNPGWFEGFLVQLEFSEKGVNHSYIPYTQFRDKDGVELMIDRESLDKKFKILSDIIANRDSLSRELNNYYSNCCSNILLSLQPLQNRYFKLAVNRGWLPSAISRKVLLWLRNHMVCEAHRDKLEYFLCNRIMK